MKKHLFPQSKKAFWMHRFAAHLLHCVNLAPGFVGDLLVFGADAVL